MADYPEQCLVTCTKSGTCAKCKARSSELEDEEKSEERTQEWTESIIEEAKQNSEG